MWAMTMMVHPTSMRNVLRKLRAGIDAIIDRQVDNWYDTVPYAAHLEGKTVNSAYYQRHLIETAWRIRLLRVAEAKALAEIAKISPRAAQIWANYENKEMLHDELFIQDLTRAGISTGDLPGHETLSVDQAARRLLFLLA